jgi:hypothetical protein
VTPGPFSSFGESFDFYYARGVGLIYWEQSDAGGIIDEYQIRNWKVF